MIQEINWGNFKAKFNGKEQDAFEWLCYLLFCKETKQETGISRFKNHAGIETDPVNMDGQRVGWQAKFYDTTLSGHKDEFIGSIKTTKTRYPDIEKIIFYTNQDFGQNKTKTDPQYKKDIEKYAQDQSVAIEWRTASYFESPFVCDENARIAKHFFAQGEKSVIDFIDELSRHTEGVLHPIRSEINFNNKTIKIDRSLFVQRLHETIARSPLIAVSGEAGVGKTAVVKDFYNQIKETAPFFVFKASEFNIANVNQLFSDYGNFTLSDLIQEYENSKEKFIVVDSAEKLSDIEHTEVFQEFLSTLHNGGWNIIFTTRLSYLEDLKNAFIQIYNVSFEALNIPGLTKEELVELSIVHGFSLPQNERLQKLLQNPFYLSEYLHGYPTGEATISYVEFKDAIWNKQIAKSSYQKNNSHRKRENCFLAIAQKRAASGDFFVIVDGCEDETLQQLESDEVIKFDSNSRGYFITHDIYEEWALDKLIEQAYCKSANHEDFYTDIGSSLAIRRAFRSWLSEKLASKDKGVMALMEATIDSGRIEQHWKDDVIVAVLLSDDATVFIDHFEQKLLELPEKIVEKGESSRVVMSFTVRYKYDNSLLHRVLFLLRIACKEIDQNFLKLLGISKFESVDLSMLVTKPRGRGWSSLISFINRHKEELGLMYMHFILPVLDDWNQNNKEGETTKDASQIALYYIDELTKDGGFAYSSRDETRNQLTRVVLNGSFEVQAELRTIFNEIISKKDTNHRGRYYELVKAALGPLTKSNEVAKNLPTDVMRLADLFWFYIPEEKGYYTDYRNDIEQYFDLSEGLLEYYPSSAFQTPTFQLLQTAPKETVDFILTITNRSIEYFAKSKFAQYEVEEVDVFVANAEAPIKQYVCHRIWSLYRGTQAAPHLLESIHMALERWLLMIAKTATSAVLEAWCLYLIKNSRSASITAIVVSIILAEPAKLFNVALVVFRTKKFFFYDLARMQLDADAKDTYSISHDPGGMFKNERLQTCNDKHRMHFLENQALNYQLFSTEGEEEGVVKIRQEALWKIFYEYYEELSLKNKETEIDKTWRLCLARMDRRKMNITTEKKGNQILINLNPEIDPELRRYSEESTAKNSEVMRYLPLQLWARNRFKNNQDYKKYVQYEDDHKMVISETKQILEGLKDDKSDGKSFTLFYRSVPAYTCSVLIRDFLDKLDSKEKRFCKNILLECASTPLKSGYRYQSGDGVDVAINVLPFVLKIFPQNSKEIKEILLLTLFDSYPVGMSQHLSDFAVSAMHNLWKENPDDANSIFIGYLLLKPKFDKNADSIRRENHKKNIYESSNASILDGFVTENESDIRKVISKELTYEDVGDLKDLDPEILVTAFLLLPLKNTDYNHKKFARELSGIFSSLFKNHDRKERLDYGYRHPFLEKFAYFVLTSEREDLELYLKPFIDDLENIRDAADIFSEFIRAEDYIDQYEIFWEVWKLFYPKIVAICKNENRQRYSMNIIHNYLLAWESWKKDAKEWHSLKEREKAFFKKVAEDIGDCPAVLYSLSKLLNEIGSSFAQEGIFWISDIFQRNPNLASKELEVNTIYYLENLVRTYILKNRHNVRTVPQIKKQILIVLNFLLEKGSVSAFILREDIL